MKKKFAIFLLVTIFITVFIAQANAQIDHPKREFRAAWIASVINLDWPSSPNLSTDQQKKELIDILDGLQRTGINVAIFQVRSECDAMYASTLEPWSYWLTGQQGKAPNPFYDPLEFAVEETHKRGMEIHAWFNPYRSVRSVGNYPNAANHVSIQHPDWILRFGNLKILDPGNPYVRDFVTEVIMDVVKRYDVDGVHFDDYFYPYEGITTEDNITFANYSRDFTNKANWRRDNVNIFVKQVYDSIQAIKPYVKFGISPFGIWKSGVPSGIVGLDAYSVLYADAIAWLQQQSIDYITPQLYWKFGGGQDYGKLMPWWADSAGANGRHFYPGQAAYRINEGNWSSSELPNQIRANRKNTVAQGSVFFRALVGVLDNEKGFTDSLKNDLYKYPALLPVMDWKDNIIPNPPLNLEFSKIASAGRSALKWDIPTTASDGDSAVRYVVYHFNTASPQQSDYNDAKNIYSVEGSRISFPSSSNLTAPYHFSVTALDRNYNESAPSNVVEITAPSIPVLAVPLNEGLNARDTTELKWLYADRANSYQLQVSSDSLFGSFIFNSSTLPDTVMKISGMIGLTKYFWRVKAFNIAGESDYSQVYNFTTGFPVVPVLLDPPHATLNVSLTPALSWRNSEKAETYRIQLATTILFQANTIIYDTTLSDTVLNISQPLIPNKKYFWRVSAVNSFGASAWTNQFGFQTTPSVGVADEEMPSDYSLSQNYPNPFNPNTEIRFSIPASGYVELKIYDILGREINSLVNKNFAAGSYSINWDGRDNAGNSVPTGMYVYRISIQTNKINSGLFVESKKMILLR